MPPAGIFRARRKGVLSVNLLAILYFLTWRTVLGIDLGKLEEVGKRRGGDPGAAFSFRSCGGMRGGL